MTSILTADIIGSRTDPEGNWIKMLRGILNSVGPEPKYYEFYRGDAFQVEVKDPTQALHLILRIKAGLKTQKLDARIALGIGQKSTDESKITLSNGSAFVRSGELFETLKPQKLILAVNSGNPEIDQNLNLIFKLMMSITSNWLPQSAQFALMALDNPEDSQQELGKKLGIEQAAVSRRRKRAQLDLLLEAEAFYRQLLQKYFDDTAR